MNKGKILVFSAPSGAGKTTIVRSILKLKPELVFSVSATTREARKNEVEGKDYLFISEKEFEHKIKLDDFIEWEKFYGYYYGTLKSFVEKNINIGKSVVLEIDVKGALRIKRKHPEANLIFIMPPSFEELKKRLISRKTESEEDLKKRLERVQMEISFKDHFEHIIVNDDLETAKKNALKIVNDIINTEV